MTKPICKIPKKGLSRQSVLKTMKEYGGRDADYKSGKTWSLVYFLGDEHTEFLKEAYGAYFSENGLNPMAFESLKRFESEVISMTAQMLNGDENSVGTMTSGGTESCMLSVKTYRDMAKAKKLLPGKPEMVVPESVHVAFAKAAEYFGIKFVRAPLDDDCRVNVKAVKRLINRNTIMLVGSAPSYPHGVIDPIEELGEIALKKNIPLHVDSCLGGFLLPFVEKLGYEIPPFDFRIPGVTSISADLHKYGFSAKGASTICYRNMDYMKHQFFITESWPGGIFASPALLGTRPGGAIAAAWGAMTTIGEDGYTKNAKLIMDTTQRLMDGIRAIPELDIVGKPVASVFAYRSTSRDVNIYAVCDVMEKKGWNIDRNQRPEALHAMVTPHHARVVDRYLEDLREAVSEVRKNPELAHQGGAAMYGMIANIPLRGMIKNNVLKMMMDMYGPQSQMPNFENPGEDGDWSMKAGMAFVKMKKRFFDKFNL
jgi:sphinganine-1-phosphate aldolase